MTRPGHRGRRRGCRRRARRRALRPGRGEDRAALTRRILRHEARFLWRSPCGTHWLVRHAGTDLHVAFDERRRRIVEVLADGPFLGAALHDLVVQDRWPRRQVTAALQAISDRLGPRRLGPRDTHELIEGLRVLMVAEAVHVARGGRFGLLPLPGVGDSAGPEPGSVPGSQPGPAGSPEQVLADAVGMPLRRLQQGLEELRDRGYVRTRRTQLGLLFVLYDCPDNGPIEANDEPIDDGPIDEPQEPLAAPGLGRGQPFAKGRAAHGAVPVATPGGGP